MYRQDLMKERIPSTNTPDLTTLKVSSQAPDLEDVSEKENEQPKTRGRGRPAGKTATLDQLIKPTSASLTPRYVEFLHDEIHG